MEKKVVVITGASSGIGLELAKKYIANKFEVYGIGQRDLEVEGLNYIKCNIANFEEVQKTIKDIIKKSKRIDILVNNAGIGISGPVEFTSLEDAKKIFDINFYGVFHLIKATLQIFREQGFGRVVNVSSVASFVPIPFQAFYSSSKAAVDTLTDALRSEVKEFGIKIVAVHPGDTKTGFTDRRKKALLDSKNPYAKTCNKSVSQMEKDEQNGMPSSVVANTIYKVSLKKNPKLRNVVGGKYKFFSFVLALLPRKVREWAVRAMYF